MKMVGKLLYEEKHCKELAYQQIGNGNPGSTYFKKVLVDGKKNKYPAVVRFFGIPIILFIIGPIIFIKDLVLLVRDGVMKVKNFIVCKKKNINEKNITDIVVEEEPAEN